MRRTSLDLPTTESRRRMGLIRNQVTANLYRVTIDNATVSASTFEETTIPRGTRVPIVWHPERNFWEIEFTRSPEYLVYEGDEQLYVVEITESGIGTQRLGPAVLSPGGGVHLSAVAHDGSYLVADVSDGVDYLLGLFLWDAAAKTFASTAVDTLNVSALGLSAGVSITGLTINKFGDLAFAGEDTLGYEGPYVYRTSAAGFGAAYSPPASPAQLNHPMEQVLWHPNGTVLLSTSADSDGSSGGWFFTTGVGFGGPIAQYDGTGWESGFPDADRLAVSPNGNFVLVTNSHSDGSAVWPYHGIYAFDDTIGFVGPRLAALGTSYFIDHGAHQLDAISDTAVYTLVKQTGGGSAVWLSRVPYTASGFGDQFIDAETTEADSFPSLDAPFSMSPSGRFVAWTDDVFDEIRVYATNHGGRFTCVGVIPFYPGRGAQLSWRTQ